MNAELSNAKRLIAQLETENTAQATEIAYLRFFRSQADFGPAHSDVVAAIDAAYIALGNVLPEGYDRIMIACPQCGAEQEDFDGFGVIHCEACGYCVHPSVTDGVCGICGAVNNV